MFLIFNKSIVLGCFAKIACWFFFALIILIAEHCHLKIFFHANILLVSETVRSRRASNLENRVALWLYNFLIVVPPSRQLTKITLPVFQKLRASPSWWWNYFIFRIVMVDPLKKSSLLRRCIVQKLLTFDDQLRFEGLI